MDDFDLKIGNLSGIGMPLWLGGMVRLMVDKKMRWYLQSYQTYVILLTLGFDFEYAYD